MVSHRLHPTPLCSLSTAETLLVWAVRHWVQSMRANLDPGDLLRRAFATVDAEDAAQAVDSLLWITLREATSVRDVGCLRCPTLGEGERDILRAVAFAQRGEHAAAVAVLATWLPPGAARAAYAPVATIARTLRTADLSLPLRAHPAAPLDGGTRAFERPALLH